MNVIDKVIEVINPRAGLERIKAREDLKSIKNILEIKQGYSNKEDVALSNWNTVADSPDNDILEDLDELRGKSRHLYMNNELAGAALKKIKTKVVGAGLLPKPTINYSYLGITREEAKKIEKTIKTKFNAWATSVNSDAGRMHDFFTIQSLIQLSWIMNGDAFVVPRRKKRKGVNIELCLQLIEADRVMNPNSGGNQNIKGGVEFDEKGELKKYYIANKHPGDSYSDVKGYPVFNSLGRRNILHIFEPERIGQRRGVPILASLLYPIKQLGRYKNAEIQAAVINAMIGLIIESEDADDLDFGNGFGTKKDKNGNPDPRGKNIDLDHGTMVVGKKGEKIKEFNTTRPNKNFKDFVEAIYEEIGAQLEIPREVLMSSFKASYSASKASLEEAHQRFIVCRKLLERTLCQPVYEEFVLELIKNGEIECPRFFEDETARYAFTRCIWVGSSKTSLDPLKEANANMKELANYTTTRGIIAAQYGWDIDDIIEERIEEERLIAEVEAIKKKKKGDKNG